MEIQATEKKPWRCGHDTQRICHADKVQRITHEFPGGAGNRTGHGQHWVAPTPKNLCEDISNKQRTTHNVDRAVSNWQSPIAPCPDCPASPNPQNPSPMGWTDHFDFSSEKRSLTKKIDREKAPEPEGDCIGAVHGATIWRLLLKICQSPGCVACQHPQPHTCRGLHKQETIHDGSTGQNKWVVRIR